MANINDLTLEYLENIIRNTIDAAYDNPDRDWVFSSVLSMTDREHAIYKVYLEDMMELGRQLRNERMPDRYHEENVTVRYDKVKYYDADRDGPGEWITEHIMWARIDNRDGIENESI